MKARIIRIGNSHGIRIPKPFLEQARLNDEVEIEVRDDSLIVRPTDQPRAGWAAAFQEMARRGDDALLDPDGSAQTTWDAREWEW
jgi:antitoxin MazE